MEDPMSPIKSTIVRTKNNTTRWMIAALQAVSPSAAASVASRLFLATPARPAPRATLPEARRFEVRAGRERLAAWSWGNGATTALLVHGWGGRANQMRGFVEPLQRAGYRVVAFDAPGHGLSAGSQLSLPEFAAAIRSVSDAVGPVDAIVGHSFGAAAACVAITEGLAVRRAVLLGPPAAEERWFARFSDYLALSAETRAATKREIERRVGAPFARFEAEALGPALKLPLLVVHDREDREVPWEDGARISGAARDATLVTTVGLGHRRILLDPSVIARVVAFVGERAQLLSENDDLQRELWDRAERWSRQSAA
jgi:pimeloyl-ACP methyl ester carboxylesterase